MCVCVGVGGLARYETFHSFLSVLLWWLSFHSSPFLSGRFPPIFHFSFSEAEERFHLNTWTLILWNQLCLPIFTQTWQTMCSWCVHMYLDYSTMFYKFCWQLQSTRVSGGDPGHHTVPGQRSWETSWNWNISFPILSG